MNQILPILEVSEFTTRPQESELFAVLHQQTDELPLGATDEELAQLLWKTVREATAANVSEFKALKLFIARARSLGVPWEQSLRVVEDYTEAQDHVQKLCRARREFAK